MPDWGGEGSGGDAVEGGRWNDDGDGQEGGDGVWDNGAGAYH